MNVRKRKAPRTPPERWWVFKLKSGKIVKHFGTELRDGESVFEVYNENIMTGFVHKDEIVDRWAQDSEYNPRENWP